MKDNKENRLIVASLISLVISIIIFCVCVCIGNCSRPSEEKVVEEIHDRKVEQKVVEEVKTIDINNYKQTLTKFNGVYYYNGKAEKYYSSRILYHYKTSEWILDVNGFYHDVDGYFVIASNDYPIGTVINVSMGKARVLDCGCDSGTIDFYVNW